jgi:hypothetical protein
MKYVLVILFFSTNPAGKMETTIERHVLPSYEKCAEARDALATTQPGQGRGLLARCEPVVGGSPA